MSDIDKLMQILDILQKIADNQTKLRDDMDKLLKKGEPPRCEKHDRAMDYFGRLRDGDAYFCPECHEEKHSKAEDLKKSLDKFK